MRNYEKKFNNKELVNFVQFCKKNKRKIYLANDIKKAKNLNFNGVYIPAFNRLAVKYNFGVKNKFDILGSAHDIKEILIKKNQNIDMIFLSPLFEKDNKKKLGIIKFNLIRKNFAEKFIALGGINQENKKLLGLLKINGYAAIRHFRINN